MTKKKQPPRREPGRAGPIAASLVILLLTGYVCIWNAMFSPMNLYYGWDTGSGLLARLPEISTLVFALGALVGGYMRDKFSARAASIVGAMLYCLGLQIAAGLTGAQQGRMIFCCGLVSPLGAGMAAAGAMACLRRCAGGHPGLAAGAGAALFLLSCRLTGALTARLMLIEPAPLVMIAVGAAFPVPAMMAGIFLKEPPEPGTGREFFADKKLDIRAPLGSLRFWAAASALVMIPGAFMLSRPVYGYLPYAGGEFLPSLPLLTAAVAAALVAGGVSDSISRPLTAAFLCALALAGALFEAFGLPGAAEYICTAAGAGLAAVLPAMLGELGGIRSGATLTGVGLLLCGVSGCIFPIVIGAGGAGGSAPGAAAMCALPAVLLYMASQKTQ